MTASQPDLPEPLTPPDCDLRGVEPPWGMFARLAVDTYGIPLEEAQAFTDQLRRDYWRERAGGA